MAKAKQIPLYLQTANKATLLFQSTIPSTPEELAELIGGKKTLHKMNNACSSVWHTV